MEPKLNFTCSHCNSSLTYRGSLPAIVICPICGSHLRIDPARRNEAGEIIVAAGIGAIIGFILGSMLSRVGRGR